MLTIDLEKKMIAGKKANKQAELAIREVNNLLKKAQQNDVDILDRLGMTHNITVANREKTRIEQLSKYDSTRVFHEDEIGKICNRYALRFLPSNVYKGTIDPLMPSKVAEFEKLYGTHSYKICAPASAFKLEEKPKDPLLFASIGNDYYYLVHKWGNDLSINRIIVGLLINPYIIWMLIFIGCTIAGITVKEIGLGVAGGLIFGFTIIMLCYSYESLTRKLWKTNFK